MSDTLWPEARRVPEVGKPPLVPSPNAVAVTQIPSPTV